MFESLSLMHCLTKLYVSTNSGDMDNFSTLMIPIILNNSSTLRRALVFELPVENGVVYPQLTILDCMIWKPYVIAVCPRLEKLDVYLHEVVTLDLLSSEKMKGLGLMFNPKLIIGGSLALIEKLQGFKHLKELTVDALDDDPDYWDWEFHTPSLLKLFSSNTELEQLYVRSDLWITVNMDSYVETLVSQNPRLQYVQVDIAGTTMTDVCLIALSRLTNLDTLALGQQDRADFTTLGILSLLRGQSRSTLQYADINHSQSLDMAAITAELQSISRETGRVVLRVENELEAYYPTGGILRWELSGSAKRFCDVF